MTAFEDVVAAIGHTPLVRLRLGRDGVRVYAKLEMQNLYTMKDRVGREMVLAARRSGALRPGAPIVESSSGSMALGLAVVGRSLGHAVHIVTDPRIDPITFAKLRALGCEVHVVAEMNGAGWQGARLEQVDRLLERMPDAFYPRQYSNPNNPAAYAALAEELLADLESVDVLVGSVGSGGSLCGTVRALRRAGRRVRAVAVDSVGSVLFGAQPDRPGRLQSGLGNSLHVLNVDHAVIDEVHWLNDREAFLGTRELAAEQQLFAGNTAGSVYRILRQVVAEAPPGSTVVGILPDRGDRYVETVYDDAYWAAKGVDALEVADAPKPVRYGEAVTGWSRARLREYGAPDRLAFVESNTTGSGMAALAKAREMGLLPVLYAADPSRYPAAAQAGAELVELRTADPAALRAALAARPLAGLTTTSDYYVQAVAELAGGLGLPGNSPEAVAWCRDKSATRRRLAESGVPQPAWRVVEAPGEVAAAVAAVGLPCVVKPVDDSGSSGVRRCEDTASAGRQVAAILARTVNDRGQPTAGRALVEEYVEGAEFSVETFSADGTCTAVGVTATRIGPAPWFVEMGHAFPARTADLPDAAEPAQVARQALKAVGYTWGPAHTELRLCPGRGPVVLEINARLAGGMIPELVRLAHGVDLVQQQLCLAVGRPVHLAGRLARHAGIRFLTAPAEGVLAEPTGLAAAAAVPGVTEAVVTRAPGAVVRPARSALDRLGHVIAVADTAAEVEQALDAAVACVRLRVTRGDER
ncbi:pyridoxal-phosphate dependent enzyme [Allonocardiopsis opalescens]|uniref:pyridoxal-phosphate dependent enzyme n=1 Tax=Allonocardiopsis opalescens TaxID=1144618 RepID=UPI001B80D43D|nr:pyridoxal-phosphate dependent enzyme [Allonocardiopsis opalescens]